MNPAFIPLLGSAIKKIIDKAIPDKVKAQEIQQEIENNLNDIRGTELKGAIDIILSEAKGESWLQRNWRPGLMVWFAILVGAYWFGYTPENLPSDVVEQLFTIIQYGVSGYILGRSGEKIMKEYKK